MQKKLIQCENNCGANNFIGINIFLWFFDLPTQANNLKIIVPYLLSFARLYDMLKYSAEFCSCGAEICCWDSKAQ